MSDSEIALALESALGKRIQIVRRRQIGGGCIHHAFCIETKEGRFFIKHNATNQYENFHAEADGLNTLAETNTLRVPNVIAVAQSQSSAWILMEWIEAGKEQKNFWEYFGETLARLHRCTQVTFGYKRDNFIGSLPQRNKAHAQWSDFFREERLLPMIHRALQAGRLTAHEANRFERLFPKLDALMPNEKPALLHGDLWSGNFLIDERGLPTVIDPAVYYGHREAELAFMHLFGGFEARLFECYHAVFPLERDWRERIGLFNLYPLLVHLNLFGRSYWGEIDMILRNLSV